MVASLLMFSVNGLAAASKGAVDRVVVRPGMMIHSGNSQCTIAFLFVAGGNTYASTAGHCFNPWDAELVFEEGQRPVVHLGFPDGGTAGPRIGVAVYAVAKLPVLHGVFGLLPDVPEGMDFGLILLDKKIAFDPALCLFGGPTGLNDDLTTIPTVIHMYGGAFGMGHEPFTNTSTLPGRTGVAVLADPNVTWLVIPELIWDSGSPIIDDSGRAVATQATGYAVRVTPALERVRQVLDLRLELLTAPLADPVTAGSDPDCLPVTPNRPTNRLPIP